MKESFLAKFDETNQLCDESRVETKRCNTEDCPRADDVLILSSKMWGEHGTKASLTNLNGKEEQVKWSDDRDATAYGHCSFIYEDQFYILGHVYNLIYIE